MSKKTIYFDSVCGYTAYAETQDGKLCAFGFEKSERGVAIGDVYKGRVESVLPGMQAAFINCGLERNCYMSADDMVPDKTSGDITAFGEQPLFPNISEGDEILVQVVKLPQGNKGARVTSHPSFVGKTLIYMPDTPAVGVSHKITDSELRKNLLYTAEKLKSAHEGVILRTVSPYARRSQLEDELSYLRNLYAEILKVYKTAEVGKLLYTDASLPVRVLRDTLSYDIECVTVGNENLVNMIADLVKLYPPSTRRPVILHNSGRDMFEETGISAQIAQITKPRVELENGAHIVIEQTEALTVIDVNTGKFTGDDSLEQTVYYTNILAAREIARQVKLRNIGGIVVVDFIDMGNGAHGKSLVEELKRALDSDKCKCKVLPMSEFGLVQFTRKRSGISPLAHILKPCKHCKGTGQAFAPEYSAFVFRAKLLSVVADGNKKIAVKTSTRLFNNLLKHEDMLEDIRARISGAEVYIAPCKCYDDEKITFSTDEKDFAELPENAIKL